jgi:VWFA-related protein
LETRPTFRTAADTVLLQVSVLDERGSPVLGLTEEDFTVLEDGVPRAITFFEHRPSGEAVPTGIVLLIDTSSSMKGLELAEAKRAAARFLLSAPSHAEVAVAGFDRETCVVRPLTRDRGAAIEGVLGLEARGGTALYDGVLDAIGLLDAPQLQRQLLVVLSDGMDLDSGASFSEVEKRLESSAVVVYAVGHYSSQERARYLQSGAYVKPLEVEANRNPAWVLTRFAELSGGAAYFPARAEELEPLFRAIARDIEHHYLLAYSPPDAPSTPRFRAIEVRTSAPRTVRVRRGYVR